MQELQLYIGSERVELFKDETVSLTQTIQNVKDIKKIFTEFTQTFSVPASKNNNLIFKHYYNFNIENGFDARRKATASLELNGILFKEGKITLNGVDLKNNLAHTYRVTFYGKTVNLKDILGNDQLSGLSGLDQYNQLYTPTDVTTSMQDYVPNTNDNILVPLISQFDRMIYESGSTVVSEEYKNIAPTTAPTPNGIEWSQFKYAIRVQAIIDAIELKYTIANGYESDIVFSNYFFNKTYPTNATFTGLFMWLHRKKGDVSTSSQIDVSWSQVNDLAQYFCLPAGGCVNNSTVTNGILNINPFTGYVVTNALLTLTPAVAQDYSVRVLRNGVQIAGFNNRQGSQTISLNGPDNGEYIVQIASATTLTFTGISWIVNWIGANFQGGDNRYGLLANFDTSLNVEFNIAEQIPKMTVIKFLEGIFQMFNLTAYVDNGIIQVKPLDNYYNFQYNYTNINIDQYLDVVKSTVNIALPFKKVNFLYKGTQTFLANQFEQVNNTPWGSLSYTLNEQVYDAPSESYSIELPFEHMMFERLYDVTAPQASTTVQWGYFVNDNQESYFGSPLLFYPIRQTGIGTTDIVIRNGGTSQEISSYFIPSNSVALEPTVSKLNIHFNNYINEWQANEDGDLQNEFTDTLFKTQYQSYIENVFNEKQRLTTVTAYLPYKIFSSLQLNNVVELGQNRYFINSMTTNLTTGKTKFELLNNFLPLENPM
jgi:hypothetical protein